MPANSAGLTTTVTTTGKLVLRASVSIAAHSGTVPAASMANATILSPMDNAGPTMTVTMDGVVGIGNALIYAGMQNVLMATSARMASVLKDIDLNPIYFLNFFTFFYLLFFYHFSMNLFLKN